VVKATEDRVQFWTMLKAIALPPAEPDREAIVASARAEMAQSLASQLLGLAGGGTVPLPVVASTKDVVEATASAPPSKGPDNGGYIAAYIDTASCTACDECTKINPKIFAYNEQKKAYVKDPKGGPFKDIVRAAEKCSARVIHPGTPADPHEKDVDKLIKRAEKFN
jgi:pyruvate-ferredoxin/flavodoxin oxidoreductase